MKKTLKINLLRKRRKNRTRATLFGTTKRPRLSVFRSNRYLWAQIINDEKGQTVASGSTKDIKNGNKTNKAGSLGTLLAEKAKKAGIKSVVFDRGFYKYHGRIKALAEKFTENLK